jgi:hypothetical protein
VTPAEYWEARAVLAARRANQNYEAYVLAALSNPRLRELWVDETLEAKVAEWSGDEWGRD